jgi:hypothetical protein
MPKTARPVQVYDFTAFSRRTPTQQQPGDRIDAQFKAHADAIVEIQRIVDAFRPAPTPNLDQLVQDLKAAAQQELQDLWRQSINAARTVDEARVELQRMREEVKRAREIAEDAQARLQQVQQQLVQPQQLAAPAPREPTLPTPTLYVNAGGPYAGDDAGATATSADYAQVSIEWAEHMPDTIPPNVLAINAISGDHWSSRWWANRAAQIVSGLAPLPSGIAPMTEALSITGTNAVSNLQHAPYGAVTLFYNGQAFTSLDPAPAFTVAGQTINWTSTAWSLIPGQSLVAQYFYATG